MYRELATGPIGVDVPFDEAARLAQVHGFRSLSLSAAQVQELGTARVKDILDARGLAPGIAGMPVDFRKDDDTFERGLAELPKAAEALESVGCTRILTWLMPWHETLTYQKHFDLLAGRTRRICSILAEHGIRYGLEFVGPETMRQGRPNPFIHDLPGILSLIEAVEASNLGILLDAFHWYTCGGTREDLVGLTNDLIVGVHVNDAQAGRSRTEQMDQERAMPGETGVIDIATFMLALDALDYDGPVIVEPFSQWVRGLPADQAVRATAESLDKIWATAGLA